MRVGRCAGSGTETRQKMLVTHELGHAMARLRYGYDGNDSPLNDDYNPPAGKPAECVNVGGYDLTIRGNRVAGDHEATKIRRPQDFISSSEVNVRLFASWFFVSSALRGLRLPRTSLSRTTGS